MNWRRVLALMGTLVLVLSVLPIAAAANPLEQNTLQKIEPLLLSELSANGQTDYFVWMAEKADLSPAYSLRTKEEKGRFVYETLVAVANRTQQPLLQYLDGQGIQYESFYIANKVLVHDGNYGLLMNVAARPDVAKITANHHLQLQSPVEMKASPEHTTAVEPNISFVNADDAWALGVTGSGMIAAGNDTGLDETHPAIARHYRGCLNPPTCSSWDHNYNWWDATGTYPTDPNDGFGHGTHTTGTMVGDDGGGNQIGMAPGAKTIHCKNMTDGGGGDDNTFTTCFQWDLAPWDLNHNNPRPDMAPDSVNNSWGYGGGNYPAFEDEIAALQAAGIAVEVSAGNEGSGCGSLRSPGDYLQVLTTGSVNHNGAFPGTITAFSSRGPSALYPDDYFPDIMAPGNGVRSCVPGGSYESWSGTSMAGPHATALIALIWSANPALRGQVELTYDIIKQTAGRLTGQGGSNCGGDYTNGPNNDWGYGTIDALAAVEMARGMGGAGYLDGTVTDATTGTPIEGAAILAEHEDGFSWDTNTDASGYYTLTVAGGIFTVTASAFGYYPEVVANVLVETDTVTTQDVALTPLPNHVISGTVTDAVSGAPLAATISAAGTSIPPVQTDPSTGFYALTVPEGSYTLHVGAVGYWPTDRDVVADHDQTQNFELNVFCNFDDDVENGNIGWTTGGSPDSWAITTESSHSPTHSWTDSPGGNYPDSSNNYILSPVFNLSGFTNVTLSFWHTYATETNYDYCYVEYSTDGGTTWAEAVSYNGTLSNWTQVTLPLSQLDGQSNARIRFHFTSDGSVTFDGWHVDDILLNGDGPGCQPQGQLTGQVTHAYYGTPIEGATVTAALPLAGASIQATTDPNGYYTMTLFQGIYDVTAAKTDYSTVVVPGVEVTETSALDIALDSAVAVVTPDSLHAYVAPSGTVTLPLNIANPGGLTLSFAIAETTATLPLRYVGQDVTVHVPAAPARPNVAAKVQADARPASDVTVHVGYVSTVDIRVLLVTPDVVGGGDISWVQGALAAFPDLIVTLWDGNAGTPTVADMQAYDVVFVGNDILWTSSAIDKTTLSNNLADYIDAGGKVLASSFVWSYDDWGFGGGRFITADYSPFEVATQDFWDPISLGNFDAGHPIMAGITSVSEGYNHQDPALSPNGVWVASWSDTQNFVAVAPSCVGLNALYFSAAVPGGQAAEVLHNAFLYLMGGNEPAIDVPWVSEAPTVSVVLAGTDLNVDVTFTALPPYNVIGDYTAALVISHNDPVFPDDIVVPITMSVVACIPVSDADFGWAPITPTVGQTVAFTGTAVGEEPIAYTWDLGDGNTATGANVSHAYTAAGTYTVVMTATNCGGQNSVVVSYDVTVLPAACIPVSNADFTWTPITPTVGEMVQFNGTAEGDLPIGFDWDFGDSSLGAGANPTHTYAAAGVYTVTMMATNCAGAGVDGATYLVTVVEPTCDGMDSIDFSWTPTNPVVGDAVDFTASVTGGTGPFAYAWTFGDGGTGAGLTATHSYTVSGIFTVTLTVTDACGELSLSLPVTVGTAQTEWTVFLPIVFKGVQP